MNKDLIIALVAIGAELICAYLLVQGEKRREEKEMKQSSETKIE